MKTIQHLTDRVRAEFLEMPGLRLTVEQVQRLCGIERNICELLLDSLVKTHFLCLKPDRHYARVTEGGVPRARPVKATLSVDTRTNKAS